MPHSTTAQAALRNKEKQYSTSESTTHPKQTHRNDPDDLLMPTQTDEPQIAIALRNKEKRASTGEPHEHEHANRKA